MVSGDMTINLFDSVLLSEMNTCQPTCLHNIHKFTHPSFRLGWDSMSAKRFPAEAVRRRRATGNTHPFPLSSQRCVCLGRHPERPQTTSQRAERHRPTLNEGVLTAISFISVISHRVLVEINQTLWHTKRKYPCSIAAYCYLYSKNRSGALVLPTSALYRNSQNAWRTATPSPSTESCKKQSGPSRKS